jgi:hypothetical protein
VNDNGNIRHKHVLCKAKSENEVSNQVRLLSSTTFSASSRKVVIPRSSSQVDSSGFEWMETVSESTTKTGWRVVGLLFFYKRDLAGLLALDISSSIVSYTEEREI